MKVALLCSGLGHVHRGHEVFARDLFTLVGESIGMTLFKGGGPAAPNERVVAHVRRDADCLGGMRLAASPKWLDAAKEQERIRVEGETFGYAALEPLLEGGFDVVHCLEQEVCNVVYAHRHLFRRTPSVLFSNGGAIPARRLPQCDHVQEHSAYNLARSATHKAFMIPHGVDTRRFRPGVATDVRARFGIPPDALLVISVGSIGHRHKRMDHVVREVAAVDGAWLLVAGQETADTPAIEALARGLMGRRAVFTTLSHDELPSAYAAADVFTLGSLFETFGIVYIEAMAMGLPVICTDHANQRAIVKEGIFIDMAAPGALTAALRGRARDEWAAIGQRGRAVAVQHYDLQALKERYVRAYHRIADAAAPLPRHGLRQKVTANFWNLLHR